MTIVADRDDVSRDRQRPPELEHDTIWRDTRYWLALHGRFIAASPVIGGGTLAILIGGVVMEHAMVVRMLVATGMITDALIKKGGAGINVAVWNLATSTIVFLAGTLLAWFGRYAYQILWRGHFTKRLLAQWFAEDRYYHLERDGRIGNPEQRIQEDLYFIGYWTVWLIPFFIGAITSGTYAWVLIWQMSFPLSLASLGLPITIPLGLCTVCLITAVIRVVGAHFAGRRITRYEIIRKRLDADFRHDLAEAREFGESVAFLRGAPREEARALGLFDRIRTNWWRLTGAQMTLSVANGITASLSRLVPALVCIQPILAGQMTIGKLVVATSTFTLAMQLIAVFADEYTRIAELRASVARIRLLERALCSPLRAAPPIEIADRIAVQDLQVALPDGLPLVSISSFAVRQGDRIAIGGRSGSGKSTLLRTLAGLWPHATGQISMPMRDRIAFLPQRPYLPTGTLAAALSYPHDTARFDRDSYADALIRSDLAGFIHRLDIVAPWRKLLSPGEQQRLALARVILHRPDFVVIDEPTSALDATSEAEIYRALEAALPDAAIVTVAHSPQLLARHRQRLEVANGTIRPVGHQPGTKPQGDR